MSDPACSVAAPTAHSAAPAQRAARGRDAGLALALFTVCLAVFFAPALRPGVAFLYRDNGRMHAPHKRLVAEALSEGRLPEWNPYGGLGYPLVGGGVDAVQHPFNALLVALPFDAGFKAWALLSFLLAAMGTFAWARRLGAGFGGAVAGGLAVALSGYLVSSTDNLQYLTALGTLPLLLAAAHAFVADGGRARLGAVALASGLAAAAGDPQSWGIAVAALPAYALGFVDRPGARRRDLLGRGLAAAAAASVGAAPFLVPVLAWMPHSSRGDPLFWIELQRYTLLPIRLLELGVPGLFRTEQASSWSSLYEAYAPDRFTSLPWVASEYVGVSVLAFAGFAAARSRRGAALVGAAALFAWLALGPRGGLAAAAARLPVVSEFRYWEKVAFFTALLAAIAAVRGLDDWARGYGARGFARGTGAAAAVLLGGFALGQLAPQLAVSLVARPGHPAESAELAANLFAGVGHAGAVCLALSLLTVAGLRGRLGGRGRMVAAVALIAVDLGVANAPAYFLSPTTIQRPRSPLAEALGAGEHRVVTPFGLDEDGVPPLRPFERAAERGAASLLSGWNVDYRVGNFEAYTGMVPARAVRFRLRRGYRHELPMIGIWGVDHVVVPGAPARAEEVDVPPPHDVAAADPARGTFLLRVAHRPRAYLASEVRSVDRRRAMEFVLDPGALPSPVSVVEGPIPPGAERQAAGRAVLTESRPERVVVDVEASGPSLLVLNDTYAPGWRATVDGAPVEIFAANYLARGVWTPPGRHRVEFRYRTPGLALGWAIAAAGALALAICPATLRRRPLREAADA